MQDYGIGDEKLDIAVSLFLGFVLIILGLCLGGCESTDPDVMGHPADGNAYEAPEDTEEPGARWVCTCETGLEAHPTRETGVCDRAALPPNDIAIEATEGCEVWLSIWYPGLGGCFCSASECLLVGEC